MFFEQVFSVWFLFILIGGIKTNIKRKTGPKFVKYPLNPPKRGTLASN